MDRPALWAADPIVSAKSTRTAKAFSPEQREPSIPFSYFENARAMRKAVLELIASH